MKKILVSCLLACQSVALFTAPAFAHPGHGDTPSPSVEHYLTEPSHVMLWIAGIASAAGIVWAGIRARNSNHR
ncbi:MAG: hypothetical protein ACE37I_04705 [Rubinisphaera brasiliensis]|uniref:hypothetical protein n=1 Tax=Rubinisphaera brasiliensis TaxID=119 RepID=UPI00391B3B63